MTAKVKKVTPRVFRDDIALEAMRTLIPLHAPTNADDSQKVAGLSYDMADAMLEARIPKAPPKEEKKDEREEG